MIPAPTVTSSRLRWGQCRSGVPDVLPAAVAVTPISSVAPRRVKHASYMRRWRADQKSKRECLSVSTVITAMLGCGT